jgi:glycerophosphoryl diester phosphodiesterase
MWAHAAPGNIGEDPGMRVFNANVSRPHTGFPFLDDAPDVIPFAHRGGAYHPEIEGLENTIAAFQHASDLGYRYLETDVHATRDGVLLAFHDNVLDRVTDRRGAIASLRYAEVQAALIGGREQVPTLAQLFDEFPEARFNVDLKSAGAVRPLVDFIGARGVQDRILVGSFSRSQLNEFRRLTKGEVATSAHPLEVAAYLLSPSGRLADVLTRRRVQALQIPHRRGPLTVAGARLVRKAHRAGKHVHVWTVDDPAEMRELIARGVDGLMTDRTDILKQVLEESGDWRGSRPGS